MERDLLDCVNKIDLKLAGKHPRNERYAGCLSLSEDLAIELLKEHPGKISVSVAGAVGTDEFGPVGQTIHYITIVRKEKRYIGFDLTRPAYDMEGGLWSFEADSEEQLLKNLSQFYGGRWAVHNKWLSEIPNW